MEFHKNSKHDGVAGLTKKTIGSGTAQNLITRNECKQMNRRNKNWGLQLTCVYV